MSESAGAMRPSRRLIRMGDVIHVELDAGLADRLEEDGGRRTPPANLEDMLSEVLARTEYGERLRRELDENGGRSLQMHHPAESSVLAGFRVVNPQEALLLRQLVDLAGGQTFAIVNLWAALALGDDRRQAARHDDARDADRDEDAITVSIDDDAGPLAGAGPDDDEPDAGPSSDEATRPNPADLAGLDADDRYRVLLAMIGERDRHITALEKALDDMAEQWTKDREAIVIRLNELTRYLQAMQHRQKEPQAAPASPSPAAPRSIPHAKDENEDEDGDDGGSGGKGAAANARGSRRQPVHAADRNPLLPPDGQLSDWTPPTQRPSVDDRLIQLVAGPFSQAAIDNLLNDTDTIKEATA